MTGCCLVKPTRNEDLTERPWFKDAFIEIRNYHVHSICSLASTMPDLGDLDRLSLTLSCYLWCLMFSRLDWFKLESPYYNQSSFQCLIRLILIFGSVD